MIECDLEQLIGSYLDTARHKVLQVTLTDERGHGVMRYAREGGLVPIDPKTREASDETLARAFFRSGKGTSIQVATSELSFAKIPLRQADTRCFMGIILRFATDESASAL